MEREELIRRLMQTFVVELEEHAQSLDRGLMELERDLGSSSTDEIIGDLFRTAHSLKGASRSVEVTALETLGHRLESIFADVRDGGSELDPAMFKLLFAAVDAIREAAGRLAAGETVGDGQFAGLLRTLAAAGYGRTAKPAPAAGAPGPGHGVSGPEPSAPVGAAEASPGRVTADGAVRIPAARLDRLVALGGELLVARRRGNRRGADVDRIIEMAKRWEREWRAARAAMRQEQRQSASAGAGDAAAPQPFRVWREWIERTDENLRALRRQLDELAAGLAADRKALGQAAAPLEAELLRARMVSFTWACAGFERAVRDLAASSGKQVDLIVRGGEIEIDRFVFEKLKDPLLHLLRNAVDHGIEPPAVRSAAGKPARGRITLSAAMRNGRVEIAAADDGRGFDLAAIRDQALKRHLPVPEGKRDVAHLAFAPGLSTSAIITEVSGRGIGLDVVKTVVESLGGTADIALDAESGSCVVLTVPLSLTRIPTLLAEAGGQSYAFDSAAVQGLMRIGADSLRTMEGRDVLTFESAPVPVFSLTDVLGLPTHERPRAGQKVPVVVLGAGPMRAAFTVDELLAEQEIVVKDLGPRLRRIRNVTGAAILASGRVALILNAADLVRTALGQAPHQAISAALAESSGGPVKRLLVVDDSVTTRTLMKSILESAGYEVTAAADGAEAWQLLLETEADLVVSDIEMPRMDGFALTEAIRGSSRLRDLPVVLVTALESDEDKMRGLQAGANAYLVKSAFDQSSLIQVIGQIL